MIVSASGHSQVIPEHAVSDCLPLGRGPQNNKYKAQIYLKLNTNYLSSDKYIYMSQAK